MQEICWNLILNTVESRYVNDILRVTINSHKPEQY